MSEWKKCIPVGWQAEPYKLNKLTNTEQERIIKIKINRYPTVLSLIRHIFLAYPLKYKSKISRLFIDDFIYIYEFIWENPPNVYFDFPEGMILRFFKEEITIETCCEKNEIIIEDYHRIVSLANRLNNKWRRTKSMTYKKAYAQLLKEFEKDSEKNENGESPGLMPSFEMFRRNMIKNSNYLLD